MCWDCLADVPRVEPPFCSCCGDPVAGDVQHDFVCYACSREMPRFDLARSAVRYEGVVGDSLRALKYEGALWLVPDLVSLLMACVAAEYAERRFDRVVSVPLFSSRRRSRGYNQAALLASALAARMRVPYKESSVRRIRSTVSQTGLTAPQRAANVIGAFRSGLFSSFSGDSVLLVDDVMTTGATVNACSGALKARGAKSVCVVTVARG